MTYDSQEEADYFEGHQEEEPEVDPKQYDYKKDSLHTLIGRIKGRAKNHGDERAVELIDYLVKKLNDRKFYEF